jgi:hypothetical protein
VKNVGNTAALNVAKNAVKAKRVAGLVKARQVKATKAGLRALPGFGNNQNSLFNNNLAKKANKKLAIRAKKLSALEKARAAKKMHAKNLPGWYNVEGEMFGSNKTNAAVHAVKKTNEKLEKGWHPALMKIMEGATPDELAAELGPADLANIERTPYHYAEHVVSRAQRELMAKTIVVDEQHQQIEAALNAIMDD